MTTFLENHILRGDYPYSVVAIYLVEAISVDGIGAVDVATEYLSPEKLSIVLKLAMGRAARQLMGDVVLALKERGVEATLDQDDEIEVDEYSDEHGWHYGSDETHSDDLFGPCDMAISAAAG